MAKFHNVNHKGFNFRNYLDVKYEGLFDKSVPTKKDVNDIKVKIKHCRDQNERKRLETERNRMVSRFNEVWKEWRKQQ